MPRLLLRERHVLGENSLAETVIRQLPRPVPGSPRSFNYRDAAHIDFVLRAA